MWDYLQCIYHQDNTARQFQLELEIGNFSQGNLPIAQHYSEFLNLWSEYSVLIYSKVPKEALASLQAIHEDSRCDQFLMKLRPELENGTQVVQGSSKEIFEVVNVAYAGQVKNQGKGQMQCYSCKEFGHIACNCAKIAGTNQSFATPEMVQQMIITAFSTLGLHGHRKIVSSPWFVDSEVSNHMTGSPD
ncbi:hypothetical protein ZIOFF_001809 [Zingiber officinale]|uniref:CCHC-type domain-containing protein n=1 Tax=Zingiber officinale TaxID=94328 RepID=A0A8J5HVC6_ZINOF|nr:hypothetical protein ZIOFF_001809 [Zingiber officinale]